VLVVSLSTVGASMVVKKGMERLSGHAQLISMMMTMLHNVKFS